MVRPDDFRRQCDKRPHQRIVAGFVKGIIPGAEYILSRLKANGAQPSVSMFGELHLANPDELSAELIAAAKMHQADIIKLLHKEAPGVSISDR